MPDERPKLSWSDLAQAKVGIWGFGREGAANLRKLRSLGIEPVLVDDSPQDASVLRCWPPPGRAWRHWTACDVVVKTPGISRYRDDAAELRAAGVAVAGGLGLWLAEADLDRVVCVTGTKGKSTTASVLGHLLAGLGQRVLVGGNIGVLPYDPDIDPGRTTTGSSRCPATRRPTCRSRRLWWP